MNLIVVVSLLLASVYVAMRRGPGAVFAFLYLPTLLLLGSTPPISIEPLPDIHSLSAIAMGTLIGTLLGGTMPPIRFHWIDGMILACSLSLAMTSYLTGTTWTLIAFTGNDVLRSLMPYLMARAAFFDPGLRRHACVIASYTAILVGACAAIEFRLNPNFVSRTLMDFGLSAASNKMVLKRGSFFRAMVTTQHPIDLGNVGMILAGLIVAFAVTSGIGLRDRRVLLGIGASAACVLASMSFSSLLGFAVAVGLYFALRYVRGTEYLLVPGMIAAIIGGFVFTQYMLAVDLPEARREVQAKARDEGGDSAVDGSYLTRVLIAQNAYNRVGVDAGYFGFGEQSLTKKDLALESVDNSYMLFLLKRGWVGLSLRLVLGLGIAVLGAQVLAGARGEAGRAPAAALVAVLIGTMASMFTVWFGFTYALEWTVTVAILASMRQVQKARRTAEIYAQFDGRGFPVSTPAARPMGPGNAMPVGARTISF